MDFEDIPVGTTVWCLSAGREFCGTIKEPVYETLLVIVRDMNNVERIVPTESVFLHPKKMAEVSNRLKQEEIDNLNECLIQYTQKIQEQIQNLQSSIKETDRIAELVSKERGI